MAQRRGRGNIWQLCPLPPSWYLQKLKTIWNNQNFFTHPQSIKMLLRLTWSKHDSVEVEVVAHGLGVWRRSEKKNFSLAALPALLNLLKKMKFANIWKRIIICHFLQLPSTLWYYLWFLEWFGVKGSNLDILSAWHCHVTKWIGWSRRKISKESSILVLDNVSIGTFNQDKSRWPFQV